MDLTSPPDSRERHTSERSCDSHQSSNASGSEKAPNSTNSGPSSSVMDIGEFGSDGGEHWGWIFWDVIL